MQYSSPFLMLLNGSIWICKSVESFGTNFWYRYGGTKNGAQVLVGGYYFFCL
jgi:hypothetical protein